MNDNNTDWKCKHCGHASPSHYGTCRMCGEPENVPTTYPRWVCMCCGAFNNAGEETCWSCNLSAAESETMYSEHRAKRSDPKPPKHAPISDLPPRQLAEQIAESKLLTPDARDSAITREVLARKQLRKGYWRQRTVWAVLNVLEALASGVWSALQFVAWCSLIAFIALAFISFFIG